MNNFIIIGRTNVGKSYLYNLFSKEHQTISIDQPHTTVDIIKSNIKTKINSFNILDTPGFDDYKSFIKIFERIIDLKLDNLEIIYVVKTSYEEIDLKVSKFLHSKKFIIRLYLNTNIENYNYPISNLYNYQYKFNEDGFTQIRYDLSTLPIKFPLEETLSKKITIFGKENTGKSSLFNVLVNKDLSLTDSALHTTRDAVNWTVKYKNLKLDLFDTAGFIRSKSKRKRGLVEGLSIKQSKNSLYQSDLIILMLDANTESRLDLTLIGDLQKKNKSFMLFVNKVDLIEDRKNFEKNFIDHLSKNHNFFNSLNIYFISVLNLSRLKILDLIYNKITQPFDFKTSYLNKVAKNMNSELVKITIKAKSFKIFYITAFSVNNKNYFKIFSNFKDAQIRQNTKTFIRKMLIDEFKLKGYAFSVLYG